LEQNKARASVSCDGDDELEKAFQEMTARSSAGYSTPVKRTKEELIRELKLKRHRDNADFETHVKEGEGKLLEGAKKAGKFKPIGSHQAGETNRAKKVKAKDGERKKKKVKVNVASEKQGASDETGAGQEQHTSRTDTNASLSREGLVLISTDPVDIFAGVEEYNVIEADDNEPENVDDGDLPIREDAVARGKWCEVEESDLLPLPPRIPPRIVQPLRDITAPEDTEQEQPARLIPLASSSLPSIRDFLAMDEALEAEEKKKKRKEKRKGGDAQKQRSTELNGLARA
jgi:IK cytokine